MTGRLFNWVLWTFLVGLFGLGAGLFIAERKLAPWTLYKDMRQVVHSWRATGQVLPELSYFRRSKRTAETRYTVQNAGAVSPGYLAVTRLDSEGPLYVVDLIAPDGSLVHTWPVRHDLLVEGGNPLEFPHGTLVLPDGSLLANFDAGFGMARIDPCGRPIWSRDDGKYHHEIKAGEDGIWTWFGKDGATAHGNELLRFDAQTGEHLERIHLVDDIVLHSRPNATAMTIPEGFTFKREAKVGEAPDTFHPNDIDPLPAAYADAFPDFDAGDLLISLRNINTVAIIDRETYEVLWYANGPWLQQHDPDWHADGSITVFSNNPDRFRSSILRVVPGQSAATEIFAMDGPAYDTYIMGTHERLQNGNWLILSSMEGRVLEVTAEGAPVREYSNILNDRMNAIIPNAEVLPEGYLEAPPICDAPLE